VECPGKDQSPREHPVIVEANHVDEDEGLPERSKPRSRGWPGRFVDSSAKATVRKTARGFITVGNVRDTLR
jgi:hypothetical protein